MNNFDTLFPNFTARCADLQSVLMPVAYLLLVTGMVSSTIAGRRSTGAVMRALGRTIVYIITFKIVIAIMNTRLESIATFFFTIHIVIVIFSPSEPI